MFHGTTIDDLLEIVERAEGHVHSIEMHTMEMHTMEMHNMEMKSENQEAMYPAFMAELLQANLGMVGVA
jgi:hypothetical protein